jgi:hypothetical protein
VDLNKNIFKKLQFFDQSEAMEAILDVGKGIIFSSTDPKAQRELFPSLDVIRYLFTF